MIRTALIAGAIGYSLAVSLGFSQPSHAEILVTQSEISGTFLGAGVECPQFMIDTGEQVSLMGQGLEDIHVGQRLRLTGRIARASRCMQGQAFIVAAIAVVADDDKE
jgi:hypothetical protein